MTVADAINGGTSGRRQGAAALASAALHALVFIALAATSIHLVRDEARDVIPLVIRNPAPPPPPGPGVAPRSGPPVVAAAPPPVPVPIAAPKPRPQPVVVPKPAPRPKLAAKPRPLVAQPVPVVAAPPPAAVAVAAPAASAASTGVGTGGAAGGVAGGESGGRGGGRRGGSGDDIFEIGEVAVAPRIVSMVKPRYPAVARARSLEAVIVVQAVIDRSGGVESAGLKVVRAQPPFDEAALAAIRQWRFAPGRDDTGAAVRTRVEQAIKFTLH